MNVKLFMAMSVNGMIARTNGEEDFLSHENWETFVSLAKEAGNFVVGRKTYDAVKTWEGDESFDRLTGLTKIVMSQQKGLGIPPDYIVSGSPKNAIKVLLDKDHMEGLIIGGASVNSEFLKAGLIDEVILNVEPVILGSGIPLFKEDDFEKRLELSESRTLEKGIVQLRYRVKRK